MKKKVFRTDFLFPKSNFYTGMGSILNLAGNYYSFNKCEEPDLVALFSDWGMVGQDFNAAIIEFVDEEKIENCKKVASAKENEKIEYSL